MEDMCYERRRAEACMDCVSILCVFITAGHIIILVCLFFLTVRVQITRRRGWKKF